MFDRSATEDAINLLETLVADPEVPDDARFILTRALNRLDHELRGELPLPQESSACTGPAGMAQPVGDQPGHRSEPHQP